MIKDKKKQLFISHTKVDYASSQMGILLCELLKEKYDIFCSSNPDSGIDAGKKLHDEMNRQLNDCDIFMAVVTENYLRSPHCLYEMSVVRFLKKRNPIIIYANSDMVQRMVDIADPEWISINLNSEQGFVDATHQLENSIGIKGKIADSSISTFLKLVSEISPAFRPYVGMSEETFRDLLYYCQKEGITKFGNGQVYTKDEMISKFEHAKVVYIVSTTGAGLLKTLKEDALLKALGNNAHINIILPDRDSQVCQDVAEAECSRKGFNLIITEQNRYRIESEYVATIQYLNEAYCLARKKYGKKNGKISIYSSRTLLRQTIVLVISDDNRSWGWINMTMPPLRTTDTPSIAISDDNVQKGLDKMIINHCECLMKLATSRKAVRVINGKTSAEKLEYGNYEQYWLQKKKQAEEFMKKNQKSPKVLIEIAAQHPLCQGKYPNVEFKRRLDMAIQLCNDIGPKIVWLYVPGSRHKHKGVADEISLSEAGKKYLIEHGIDESHIYAEEANDKYKGNFGVYNSADESYVASCIFKDDHFGRMICVCSPYQTMRKSLYYIEFGLISECYGIPSAVMFHDPISEYFGSLWLTVFKDHNWQGEHSEAAINSRINRKV